MTAGEAADLDWGLASALLDETATLARMSSVSGEEGQIADYAEAVLREAPALSVLRISNTLVASSEPREPTGEGAGRLLLLGHLDSVPPADPPQPVLREPRHVTGRGVVDMKGGVAVLLHLARHVVGTASVPCTIVLYEREELGSHQSGMRMVADLCPELLAADAGIVLEPTNGWIEAGCQGSLRVRVTYRGAEAHSARPWRGVNAIRLAAPAIARCASTALPAVTIGDYVFPQALELVEVTAGAGGNTIPDRCEVEVNARFAPNQRSDDVLAEVSRLFAGADDIAVALNSPPALPTTRSALLSPLLRADSVRRRPKLGWTEVGRLAQLGIPAINFGPGDPELAHGPNELVTGEDLRHVFGWIREVMR